MPGESDDEKRDQADEERTETDEEDADEYEEPEMGDAATVDAYDELNEEASAEGDDAGSKDAAGSDADGDDES